MTIASSQGSLFQIVLDDTFVYWSGDGISVSKKRRDNTGNVTPLATKQYAYSLAVMGNRLYWVNDWEHDELRYCELPDCAGGVKAFSTGKRGNHGLVANPATGKLFWAVYSGSGSTPAIMTFDAATGSIKALLEADGSSYSALATDSSFVYWAEGKSGTINKMNLGGGSTIPLMTNSSYASMYALGAVGSGAFVWGLQPAAGSMTPPLPIYRVSLPNGIGSGVPQTIGSGGGIPAAIAIVGDQVYWTEMASNYLVSESVFRCPVAGCQGSPPIAATVPGGASAFASDAQAVYWVSGAGTVSKLAR